ncbi:type VI secretion system tip protein TssI/VgrG [Muribacter muris]|uniref:type VI secretion system tip protein TssI/VgrG n=1 Tax=Muribacter muris TaxID=67855 RepID=UPI00069D531C|nr:type VI secretion system tip protein TssI/VgrG [Muribacter muris]
MSALSVSAVTFAPIWPASTILTLKAHWPYLHQHKERAYQPFDNEAGNIRHEHYDYPGRFKTSEWGQAFTRYRIDSLRRDVHCGEGASNAAILSPGRFLKLTDHPKADFNQLWQITAVRHHGEQPQSLEEGHQQTDTSQGCYLTNHFHVIPRAQSWRINLPQKPQIHGTQTATVVGPPGEEIFTDNYGRVKVQFHWDREGQHNDRSSCWIRVASHWAGEGWGMLSLPRIGQEVLVSFQEGDPDQPIIIGRVYNGTHLPPGHLPQSRTQMYIKSKTYKGKGYNSMMFDDAPHNELFEMHAERDMATLVKHDQRNHIRHDRHLTVDNTQTTTIGRGRTAQITTGNDVKSVLAGSNLETVSLLKSTVAKEIFQYGKDHIELEVGEQTSITLDNEKILLRFGQSTILMNAEGIWLDGKHIGMMEKNPVHQNSEMTFQDANELMPDCLQSLAQLKK